MNQELSDVQAGYRKGRQTQIKCQPQLDHIVREFQKNIYFCFIDYTKSFGYVDHIKLCKILKDMGIPENLTCLLRDLYAGQEAVRTGHGKMDWFQIGKGVCQGCILSPCLFNLHAEYIMWNAGLDESQAHTTLIVESEEGLKRLLIKVKEDSEKASLKLNIQKTKIMASGPITSWQIGGEKVETVTDIFLGSKNHWKWWLKSRN